MKIHRDTKGGYIALISAIIISFILIGLTFAVSSSGYFSRFNVANSEYKRVSLGLSESCVNLALLKVSQNYSYNTLTDPAYDAVKGGVVVPVGAQDCLIKSVTYGPEVAGRKSAYVSTQADYLGSFSNVKVAATIASTTYTSISKGALTVQVQVTNDSGGTKVPSDFTINLSGGNPTLTTFAGNASGVSVTVDAGVVVNESVANYFGYTSSFSPSCNTSLIAGQSVTCTIYLNDPPTTATLTLLANVSNGYGGTKHPSDFPIFLDGVPVTSGIPVNGLTPGNHVLSSTAAPSGYSASSWGIDCANNPTINLSVGDVKTCDINFKQQAPPAPACADTVVMIDRTGSLGTTELSAERTATKALLNLYAKIATPPQVGIGRFGGASGSNADILPGGTLTNVYGTDATTSTLGFSLPTQPAVITPSSNNWTTPINGLGIDSLYTTTNASGKETGFQYFGFSPLPAGSVVNNVQVIVDGKATNAVGAPTDSPSLPPTGAGNYSAWTTTGAANAWTALATNDTDTSFISAGAVGTSTFAVANSIPPGSTINAVDFKVFAAGNGASATAANIKLLMEKGVTPALQKADNGHALSSASYSLVSYTPTSIATTTNPITGLTWASYGAGGLAELNAMRFGAVRTNTSGKTPRVSQLFVTVNYTPPSSAVSVDVSLSWNNGVSTTTSQSYALAPTEASTTLSGTWGRTWGANDFTDGNFSVRVKNASASGPTAAINYVMVKLSYSTPATGLYSAIDSGIPNTPSSGGTDIASGINIGTGEVGFAGRHDPSKAKVLIILSDGLDTVTNSNTVLNASDAAKTGGTSIYFIHFGSGSGNALAASIASGTTPVAGHKPGSHNDAGTANGNVQQALADAENGDGDNFFISPTFTQLQAIFEQVGAAVCPAAGAASTPPPTTGNLIVLTHVINDNGGVKQSSDFTMQLSGTGLNPSVNNFAGVDTPGMSVTVSSTTIGNSYNVVEPSFVGYVASYGAGCTGMIGGGETKTCTVTNDDNAPAPPPPPPPPPDIDIGPWQEASTTSPGP